MTRAVRTYAGVQNEELRTVKIREQQFDDIFNEIHDTLEEAYYGDRDDKGRFVPGTGWKDGKSKLFTIGAQTFDVQAALAESKALFDRLHGLLWDRYQTAMHKVNMARPSNQQTSREDYDAEEWNEDGTAVLSWKSEKAQGRLSSAKNHPIDPINFEDPA